MLHQFHRSQLIGEMVLLLLICLLFIQFHHQALQFTLGHLLPPIIHFLLHLHLHLHLHHPLLLFLLTPNALDIPEMSGCQSNGASQIATSSPESLHLLWSPHMTIPAILMIPWTSSKLVQPPHLSWHPSDSLSNALMQICGRRLVRKMMEVLLFLVFLFIYDCTMLQVEFPI